MRTIHLALHFRRLILIGMLVTALHSWAQLISGKTYQIVSKASGSVIDDPGSSTSDGIGLQQFHINGGANQMWTATLVGGAWKFANAASGKVMDDPGGSTTPTQINQYQDNGGQNQHWTLKAVGDGSYKVANQASGLILDVRGNSTNDGTPIQQYYDNGGQNQHWIFVQVCVPHAVYGLIGARYVALGGSSGPLGCPLTDEANTPDGQGRFNDFEQGEIVWSPKQTGSGNVVSAFWQQKSGAPNDANYSLITVQWGDMWPYHYDKFLVRPKASNPGISVPDQFPDINIPGSSGSFSFANVCGSTYSIVVKGCDDHGVFGSTCNQDWSTPVNISVPTPYNYGINEGCY
jgi:hypothetical protein